LIAKREGGKKEKILSILFVAAIGRIAEFCSLSHWAKTQEEKEKKKS
jgi:hypothetical protein